MINNAITSVLDQSYQNWELIIVDDGSTDNTKEIVSEVVKKDKRVKYFFQENKERSAARNKGIKIASGEWICFLDSDDLYHSSHLEVFQRLINNNDSIKGLYFSGLSKEIYSSDLEFYIEGSFSKIEFVLLNTIGTPRACINKEILLNSNFNEDLTVGEDRELWIRILKNHPLFYHKNKTFIEVNHSERSINFGAELKSLKTIRYIFKNQKKLISNKVKKIILSNEYFNISKFYIRKKSFVIASIYLVLSIFSNLRNPQTKHKIFLLLETVKILQKRLVKEYEK
jgi:glycosyltransferase involved in cell wall biosynthesis